MVCVLFRGRPGRNENELVVEYLKNCHSQERSDELSAVIGIEETADPSLCSG
jgi:hypothetical protein